MSEPLPAWPLQSRGALGLFIAGQVPLAAASVSGIPLAITEATLLVPLLVTLSRGVDRRAALPAFAVGSVTLGALLVGAVVWFGPYWQVAGALLAGGAALWYGLHRYELVALGLVSPLEDQEHQ